MKIRKHLKQARKDKELKQDDVANFINMSTRHYRAIESGTRGTIEDNWLKLFELFDHKVPLNKLMENSKIGELFRPPRKNSSSKNNDVKIVP